jgi:hypothetical protein
MYLIHNCFDDEVIYLLYLGIPRDAMIPRAPEAEALYEGYAQKGFGFLSLGGSPFPRGSTATSEPTGVSKTLWIKKQGNTNKRKLIPAITIRGTSG